MDEEHLKKMKTDENALLEYLFGEIKETVTNISINTLEGMLKKPYNLLLYENFQQNLLESVEKKIYSANLSEMKKQLVETEKLQEVYKDDPTPAWRPETGTISIEPYIGNHLKNMKSTFEQLILEQDKEISRLVNEVDNGRNVILKQIKQTRLAEF